MGLQLMQAPAYYHFPIARIDPRSAHRRGGLQHPANPARRANLSCPFTNGKGQKEQPRWLASGKGQKNANPFSLPDQLERARRRVAQLEEEARRLGILHTIDRQRKSA